MKSLYLKNDGIAIAQNKNTLIKIYERRNYSDIGQILFQISPITRKLVPNNQI